MAIMELRFSFSALVIAIAIIVLTDQATAATDLCADSISKSLCESLVKGQTDSKKATEFIVNKLIAQTNRAKDKANKLSKEQDVKICIKSYDDAISFLKLALKALNAGDKGTTQSELSAVIASVVTCEDAYLQKDAVNTLTINNNYLKLLADTALSVYQQGHK